MSENIIGEGNEQYYQIDIKEPFTCEIGTVRKGKCDTFDEYKKIFDDKEDVKYKIYQILPILFSIDGTFLEQNQNKQTKNLTKSIYNFFTKLANYKKKKNLSYLFPRIRFEFKICPVDVIAKIIKKLSENKFIKDNYNSKFIDQLVYHNTYSETNQSLKEKINVYVLDFEFLETNQKPKWKEIIPEKNVKRPFDDEKATPVNGIIPTQPKDSPKIIFATQKKQTKSFSFYEKNGNLPDVIYKEKLDDIGFFGESDEVVEVGKEDDAETNANRASTKDDMEPSIADVPEDPTMLKEAEKIKEEAEKQEQVSDLDDKLSEFCVVKQNGKNEQREFKIDLLRCLNKNDKGKIKIVFNKDNDTILPNYNVTNDILRPNINGMKKKYTIELDGLSVNDLLRPEPALDYEGLLNKVDTMYYEDVKKELIANGLKPWEDSGFFSTKEEGWLKSAKNPIKTLIKKGARITKSMGKEMGVKTEEVKENRKKLKAFLERNKDNPKKKPLIAKLLTEFKKIGSDPFFCRKVLDRLKKMYYRLGKDKKSGKPGEFHKAFKKFDTDNDNALFPEEFKDFLHFMKAPEQDFDELWTRLSHGSDRITWKILITWINSGEWPKPVSIAVSNQKLVYSKPKSVEFQLPKGVEPGSMLTIKMKKTIKYENMPYVVDLFVLLQPIPQSAKPGEKLSLAALKLAEPDPKDTFEYIIKKEKDGNAESAFYIKYGNNDIFVKLDEKSIDRYKKMKMNQVEVLSMKRVDGQKEENNDREKEAAKLSNDKTLNTSDGDERIVLEENIIGLKEIIKQLEEKLIQLREDETKNKDDIEEGEKGLNDIKKDMEEQEIKLQKLNQTQVGVNLGKTDEQKEGFLEGDHLYDRTKNLGKGLLKGVVATALVAPVATLAVAAPVAAVYGSALAINEISDAGSVSSEVASDVLDGMQNIKSTISNVTKASENVQNIFADPTWLTNIGNSLPGLANTAGNFLLTNATNACTMVGLSAAAGPILLIALAGLAGLRVGYLIAKTAFVNGRNLYEWMNAKSLRYDVSSFKIERINLNISEWAYKKGDEVSGDKEQVMKVLKKYAIPKIVQDVTDPTKPIENQYPIYINNVQYVEEEEQETRSLSALEEDMKNERAQGIMVTPDMEGMDPADIKKAKVKKNVFYVRFHTNYLTPFKLKGEEFALTSRGETYINKKLRTFGAFNKKKSNVYFYKGMVSLREVNPSRKPPRKIFENVVKKLFKDDLKTLIFDQFSLDEEAADVIGERLKEIKNSTVLDMVVLNLLEVPSVIKILKCLADSKIKIKKLVIRRVRDTIGKMKKKKIDELYKMEKRVKKKQKIQQNVYADNKRMFGTKTIGDAAFGKRKSGNVRKDDDKNLRPDQDGGGEEIYLQHGGTLFGIFNSAEITGTAVGSANLDLIVLELVRVIKSSSLTLQHLELPGQFGASSKNDGDITEITSKIGAAIKDVNGNEIRIKSGVGLMNVIYDKQIFGSSSATKTERKAQKRVFIENSVEMIRDQMEKVQADYDAINEKVEAEASADLLDFGDMHTIETFIHPEEGMVNDLRLSIKSLDRSTKSFFGKMKDVKYLLEELKEIEKQISKLKELEAYKEQLFEYRKFLDDKKEEEELQDLEDKSKKREALKRGYVFDKEASISLTIKHDIFDKMKPEKDSMIVRYNDEWNVPEINFENPDKYRTGKKKYEYKFHFPTSVQKKEAYKRALKLRVDGTFFDNAIKVNYTNKTGDVITIGMPITITHPVYLVPISIQNPYTDNIDKGETVRLYLRGKVYKNNQMQSDDSNNFQVIDNNTIANIVMIGIKDTELAKFSIEDIKNNIMSFEARTGNLASLAGIFNMVKKINPTMKLNPGPLKFFKHEQFYIKNGVCKRIFYEENVDVDNIIDDKVDYNNVFVFLYNSSLVSNRDVRINKEYGTIYANLEKVKGAKPISFLEVKTPQGAKKIKDNKISNIIFGRKGSEIYIMSVAELEATITEDEMKKVDEEYEKNDAMLKAEEAEDAKSERLRQKYKKKQNEYNETLNEKSEDLRDEEAKISREIKKGRFWGYKKR